MHSYSTPTSKLTFCAVGGTTETRRNRASLLEKLLGVDSRAIIPGDDDLSKFGITNYIPRIHLDMVGDNKFMNYDSLRLTRYDYVLLIGHEDAKNFNELMNNQPEAHFQIMGPGFNYMAKAVESPNVTYIGQEKCHRYPLEVWNTRLFLHYPDLLNQFRPIQLGAFFTTRSPDQVKMRTVSEIKDEYGNSTQIINSAFYNQYGLTQLIINGPTYILNFEINVATELGCQAIIDKLKLISPEESTDNILKQIANIYQKNGYQVRDLYQCGNIVSSVMKLHNAVGPMEYDALVTHAMLRNISNIYTDPAPGDDKSIPSSHLHLEFMNCCLSGNNSKYIKDIRKGVKANLVGNIYVIHDLGIDAQNDDWIAICMLNHIFNP
tara:strand:- start:386 stop:1519 length:1134 start_codon:yes stop_codon:yes gene_type:complete